MLAIIALLFGKLYGWGWLDAVMGIVGAIVIIKWTINLMKQTTPILLDENIDMAYRNAIEEELSPFAIVTDLHLWKISGNHYSAAITLQSSCDLMIDDYKQILEKFDKISHLTLEVH